MLKDFIKKAAPGLSYTSVPVIKLANGTEIHLPVTLLKGARDGQIFYLGSTIHGNELNGIGVILKMIENIQVPELRGSLLCVPVQNPVAFQHKQHFIPQDVYKISKPDPVVAFPGSAAGDFGQRLAHAVFNLILSADYAVDLHTGSPGFYYWPHSFCFFSCNETADEARKLARIFGTPVMTDVESGPWVGDHIFYEAANKNGVPTFAVELGDGGCLDEKAVEIGFQGIQNVLIHLGFLPGEIKQPKEQVIIGTIVEVSADTGGFLRHSVPIGSWVKTGQEIAQVFDLHLREIEAVKAPVDGLVYVQKSYPTVNSGEEVAVLGIPKVS